MHEWAFGEVILTNGLGSFGLVEHAPYRMRVIQKKDAAFHQRRSDVPEPRDTVAYPAL